jgi:hypothetical protein
MSLIIINPPANLIVSNNTPINQMILTKSKLMVRFCCNPDNPGFTACNLSAVPEVPARFKMPSDEEFTISVWEATGW